MTIEEAYDFLDVADSEYGILWDNIKEEKMSINYKLLKEAIASFDLEEQDYLYIADSIYDLRWKINGEEYFTSFIETSIPGYYEEVTVKGMCIGDSNYHSNSRSRHIWLDVDYLTSHLVKEQALLQNITSRSDWEELWEEISDACIEVSCTRLELGLGEVFRRLKKEDLDYDTIQAFMTVYPYIVIYIPDDNIYKQAAINQALELNKSVIKYIDNKYLWDKSVAKIVLTDCPEYAKYYRHFLKDSNFVNEIFNLNMEIANKQLLFVDCTRDEVINLIKSDIKFGVLEKCSSEFREDQELVRMELLTRAFARDLYIDIKENGDALEYALSVNPHNYYQLRGPRNQGWKFQAYTVNDPNYPNYLYNKDYKYNPSFYLVNDYVTKRNEALSRVTIDYLEKTAVSVYLTTTEVGLIIDDENLPKCTRQRYHYFPLTKDWLNEGIIHYLKDKEGYEKVIALGLENLPVYSEKDRTRKGLGEFEVVLLPKQDYLRFGPPNAYTFEHMEDRLLQEVLEINYNSEGGIIFNDLCVIDEYGNKIFSGTGLLD